MGPESSASLRAAICLAALLAPLLTATATAEEGQATFSGLARSQTVSVAQIPSIDVRGLTVLEVNDYVFGGCTGEWPSPPHADLNPRRAYVIVWEDFPFRLVFAHEGSYCPWFELPSGAAVCYQFFEGNDGWAELFNDWGRREHNSFVDVIESGPERAWVRWTYFGVNMQAGEPAYRATEDFWAYPNGLVLRRQSYETLRPGRHEGYAREPIELIGMCPVGKLWHDVLRSGPEEGESHALIAMDPFSSRRYDVFWKRVPDALWAATPRRAGCSWQELDDAEGIVLALPLKEGTPFCVFGDASGYPHDGTRIKEHSHQDTGGTGWVSCCWDHWPIGWLNSQAHEVTTGSLAQYPNHFSPAGMDFFAMDNAEVERRVFWSLIGVGDDDEEVRTVARRWLGKGEQRVARPDSAEDLPAPYARQHR